MSPGGGRGGSVTATPPLGPSAPGRTTAPCPRTTGWNDMSSHRKTRSLVAAALAAALVLGGPASCATPAVPQQATPTAPTVTPSDTTRTPGSAPATPRHPPTTEPSFDPAGLPAAVHDAVVPDLFAAPDTAPVAAGRLRMDLPLYGEDRDRPVAVLPARDFLGDATTVAVTRSDGDWSVVLTPARRVLPSAAGPDGAPAQTAAYVRTDALPPLRPVDTSVIVSVARATMTVRAGKREQQFPVGVGTPGTPTPTDVSGYLQARYTDPAQGQSAHRIQLTSLHATRQDEPYGGDDGGLIGIHVGPIGGGAVSHGCIRVGPDALAAIDVLPLGTAIRLTP